MDLFFALCGAKNSVWRPLRSAPEQNWALFPYCTCTVLGPRSSGFTLLALQSTWRAGDQYSYGGLLARNFLYWLRASGFNLR